MQKEYNIYIGLKKKDMKTIIKQKEALKVAIKELVNIGILGFNSSVISGIWQGKTEKTLYINFINTFGVTEKQIYTAIEKIKVILEQENILIKNNLIAYKFI